MKNTIIGIIVILTLCAIVWGLDLWMTNAQNQRIADAKAFVDIFQYITTHENRTFDYIAAAKELNLSNDELTSYLIALQRAGKIKITPRYEGRKPIILTHKDRLWYFHRITLPHTEAPAPPNLPH